MFSNPSSATLLTPLVPGFNLPSNDLLHYFLSILFSMSFHEMGHALAAVAERVELRGFGVMFMFLLPGAYASLNTEDLETLPPARQLKVFTAGVWHNIVLCVLAFGAMFFISFLLAPLYFNPNGLLVAQVYEGSGLKENVPQYSVINSVNACPVKSLDEWNKCFSQLMADKEKNTLGYCTNRDFIVQSEKSLI